MDITHLFIDPIDTLFLRGNRLFGDPGSFGDALVPPWPSVVAGALRSALLVHRGYDPARFSRGEITDDTELGTPECPGSFQITRFQMARRAEDGAVEPLYRIPADLSITSRVAKNGRDEGYEVRSIRPHTLPEGVQASTATRSFAVLAEPRRSKPRSGLWLTSKGWGQHLDGHEVDQMHLVSGNCLWCLDMRIGIALDPLMRKASDGALFTSQGIVFRKREHGRNSGASDVQSGSDVGFLAGVLGATLPDALTLRFGGDGRSATATRIDKADTPEADYDAIAKAGKCRLILNTPGVFKEGWKPTGVTGDGHDLNFGMSGVRARVVCAAIPRAEVISGFDLAKQCPKAAQRVVPTGSVYWLDELDATPDDLRKLAAGGLWSGPVENTLRKAEGFNRITFGIY